MSNNLNLPQVSASQNQKEVTINDQAGALDAALTDILALNFATATSAGVLTLTNDQFRKHILFVGSSLAADMAVIVPLIIRGFFIFQNQDGTHKITVERGSTSIDVLAGESIAFATDGTTNGLKKVTDLAGTVTNPFDIMLQKLGVPTNAELITRAVFDRTVTFPVSLTGSVASAGTASTGNVSFDLQKNGSSIGSVVFNISATGTFTFGSSRTFNSGDVLTVVAPGTADATLANISITLAGTR